LKEHPMRRFVFSPLRCLSAALALAAPAKAQMAYQFLGPGPGIGMSGLTGDDIARMNAASARLYEGRSIGDVERWRSPASADAGEVTMTRGFDWRGMQCRTLDYTIRIENKRERAEHQTLNWCRLPDGTWRIVEVPGSH
jgi:surface antigen